ncbi:MAG TPA: DUF3015 family protein [Kofleriaceae bacterium]|nr:DUF3015 family protein [Kofleriaceae bacterium]
MKKLMIGAALATMCLAAGGSTEVHAQAYGTAGCGLGSIVLGNKPGIMQIFAATTNGTFASQTFGITSGTSNCSDTGGGPSSAKAFIETNRDALAKDISRGRGETINNLATLSGCADANAVGATLQKNFKTIFPTADVTNTDVSGSVVNVLRSDKSLSCSKLGA